LAVGPKIEEDTFSLTQPTLLVHTYRTIVSKVFRCPQKGKGIRWFIDGPSRPERGEIRRYCKRMEVNLETLPVGEDAPGLVNVVVEVPAGSRNKYEYEPELGVIMRDRVLPGNIRYPADYGFIPSTISTDGEPIDAVVAAYDPVFPGCLLKARVVGALQMGGEEGAEPNVLAVPSDDPRFDDIQTLEDLPEQNLHEIENFFVAFKRLEGDEEAQVQGWEGLEETHEIIQEGSRAFQEA